MKNLMQLCLPILLVPFLLTGCGGGGGGSSGVSTSPASKWTGTKQLGTASAITIANGIAVDSNGNIYVTGSTTGALDANALVGTQDLFLTKYNSIGVRNSTKQLGVSTKATASNAIAIDSNNNVYIVGTTAGGLDGNTLTGTQDLFLMMFDAANNKVRTKQLGVSTKATVATGVAVDLNGNVYVVGYTNGDLDGITLTGTQDFFVVTYNSTGTKIRTMLLGVASYITAATGVSVDGNGTVYVAGYTYGGLDGNTLSGNKDFFLTSYSSTGTKIATTQLGVAGWATSGNAVTVDFSGNTYVAGYTLGGLDSNTLTGTQDMFMTKYDPAGNKVRTKQLGVAGKMTEANSVVVNANGTVYVAGSTYGGLDGNSLTGIQDSFITTYDASGNKIRTKQLGITGKYTVAKGVAVDGNGSTYIAGSTTGGLDGNALTGTQDFFITKYDASGVKQ